ncbi:MAG: hypothetical protein AAFX78_06690 [Cyanobacteria bacterium J06638_20]
MNIHDYYDKLNSSCQSIFESTIVDSESFGKVHYFSKCLFDFAENLNEKQESDLLKVVCSQIEVSALDVSFGLYRQAFSSLRLALEMGLGIVYFSAFKLDCYEWLRGGDIKWAKIIDSDNGVLSKRFSKAFFPELNDSMSYYHEKTVKVYRKLSEFVHGNYETWEENGLVLSKNEELIQTYFEYFEIFRDILLFSLCCRFLKLMSHTRIDSMPFVMEDLGHNEAIRIFLGGPKEA